MALMPLAGDLIKEQDPEIELKIKRISRVNRAVNKYRMGHPRDPLSTQGLSERHKELKLNIEPL